MSGADHKFFQATQVMDEARHNEVLDRYLAVGRPPLPHAGQRAGPLRFHPHAFFPLEAYQDLGFSQAQIGEVRRYRRETAAHQAEAPVRKGFKREMHAAMITNLARLGLLTDRVRPRLAAMGVTLPAS